MLFKAPSNHIKIDINDINRYKTALLNILNRITVEKDDVQLQKDLKVIYELLSHFQLQQGQTLKDES